MKNALKKKSNREREREWVLEVNVPKHIQLKDSVNEQKKCFIAQDEPSKKGEEKTVWAMCYPVEEIEIVSAHMNKSMKGESEWMSEWIEAQVFELNDIDVPK